MRTGDIVPDFSLKDQYGKDFNLYQNLDKNILLIFYPKDNTPVCSSQLKNYQVNFDKFLEAGVFPVAVNIADTNSHKEFCEQTGVNFPVLSDYDKSVSRMFNALNFLGMNKRIIVLIGKDKKVKMIKKMLQISFVDAEKLISEINLLQLN